MTVSARILFSFVLAIAFSLPDQVFATDEGLQDFVKRGQEIRRLALCGDSKRETQAGPFDAADLDKVRAGAEAGTASCQMLLGRWHETGSGVTQDYAEAVGWYAKAAETDSDGDVALGRMAEAGLGGSQDYDEARRLYALAATAERPNASGQIALGRLYEKGLGVAADAVIAADWYRKATLRPVDEAWSALDALQSRHLVSSPAQVADERRTWSRVFASRIQRRVEEVACKAPLSQGGKIELLAEFMRGKRMPAVSVAQSSGNTAFDEAAAATISAIDMPAAPVYVDPSFKVKVPLVLGCGTLPATNAAGS